MWVHEYQVKELLRQYGVPVPAGIAVFSMQEAIEAAQKLGGQNWHVKVQVLSKKPGEYGQVVKSLEELRKQVNQFLGEPFLGELGGGIVSEKKVRRLLIEESVDVERTYSFSIAVDYDQGKPFISFGEEDEKKHFRADVDVLKELPLVQIRNLVDHLDVPEEEAAQIAEIGQQLYAIYQTTDAILLDVTMGLVKSRGRVEVIDSLVCFDDNALFRQPRISVLRDLDEENPNELEASLYNMRYTDFRGNIGCLTNGTGTAAVLLDMFKYAGKEPANFVSMEGVITEERMTAAFEIMQKNKEMRVILINMVSEVFSCDVIAGCIVNAYKSLNLRKPLVVRLKGIGEIEGVQVLKTSGLTINLADKLIETVEKSIALGG